MAEMAICCSAPAYYEKKMTVPTPKEIDSAVENALSFKGLKKRKLGYFTYEVSDDVLGVIHLQTQKRSDGIRVTPKFGVRHDGLARLLSDMEGTEEPHPYLSLSMNGSLGALMDAVEGRREKYESFPLGSWVYADAEDLDRRGPSMVAAITNVAVPFFQSHNTLEAIVTELTEGIAFDTGLDSGKRAAAGLYLLGRPDAAFDSIESEVIGRIEHLGYVSDEIKELFGEFVRNLIARMEKDGWQAPAQRRDKLFRSLS